MMKKIQEESRKKLQSVKFIQTFFKFKLHMIQFKKNHERQRDTQRKEIPLN